MATIRNEELDQLAGEVLPERTVLSSVPVPGGAHGSPQAVPVADGAHGSPQASNFCNNISQSQQVTKNLIVIAISNNNCGIGNKADNKVDLGLLGGLL
jgi:hypothetical protein